MRKIATSLKISVSLSGIVAFAASSFAEPPPKIGPLANRRAAHADGSSRVIVSVEVPGSLPDVAAAIEHGGGTLRRMLRIINAYVADVPNPALNGLANNPHVTHMALDRSLSARSNAPAPRSARRPCARTRLRRRRHRRRRHRFGRHAWHDDLAGGGSAQRVDRFVDFVNGRSDAVRRLRSRHARRRHHRRQRLRFERRAHRASRPNARLIVLKVLDAAGPRTHQRRDRRARLRRRATRRR